jgi:hypothetical protein
MIKKWEQFNHSDDDGGNSGDYLKMNVDKKQMDEIKSNPVLKKLVIDENENEGTGIKIINGDTIQYTQDVAEIISKYLENK